jgi:hypothetical protein
VSRFFALHVGRHCRRGSWTGWAALAQVYARSRRVDDYSVPRTHRHPHIETYEETPR